MEKSSQSEESDADDSPGLRPGPARGADAGMEYRNPEPPKELSSEQLINADNIGDTVFSKHWLFTTLMNLIQTVDQQENNKQDSDPDAGLDIEESLQDDLCKLWDMSMNPEVVKFLQEFQALDILTGVIAKSRAPRATEICVGILGNMACDKEVCEQMANNTKLVKLLLLLFESPDAPTLVELSRLLHACISSERGASRTWVDHIRRHDSLFTHVSFILQSSTNNELLSMTGRLVGCLLYADDVICEEWASAELVLGVLESVKQLGGESGIENVETFLHVLQLVSTCQPGVEALLSYGADLLDLCMKYLRSVCSEEVIGLEGKENSIGSALSVVNVLLASWEDSMKFLQEDHELVRCVLKILEEVFPHYNKKRCRELRRMRSRSLSRSHSSPRHSASSDKSSRDMNVSHESDQSEPQADAPGESADQRDGESKPPAQSETETRTTVKDLGKTQGSEELSNASKAASEGPSVVSTSQQFQEPKEISETAGKGQGHGDHGNQDKPINCSVFEMLYDVIQACLGEIVTVLKQILYNTSHLNEDIPLGVPECLDYLDTKCPTTRLQYMIHSIQSAALTEEGQSKDLLQQFKTVVAKYKLERIEKVLRAFDC